MVILPRLSSSLHGGEHNLLTQHREESDNDIFFLVQEQSLDSIPNFICWKRNFVLCIPVIQLHCNHSILAIQLDRKRPVIRYSACRRESGQPDQLTFKSCDVRYIDVFIICHGGLQFSAGG